MKAKEIESLESYFKTENEHWNGYAFEMLCEVLQQGNFENPETPLQLFDKAVNIFSEQHETPLKAVQEFATETDKQKLTPAQRLKALPIHRANLKAKQKTTGLNGKFLTDLGFNFSK